jgi:hypothetical protein
VIVLFWFWMQIQCFSPWYPFWKLQVTILFRSFTPTSKGRGANVMCCRSWTQFTKDKQFLTLIKKPFSDGIVVNTVEGGKSLECGFLMILSCANWALCNPNYSTSNVNQLPLGCRWTLTCEYSTLPMLK